MKTHKAHTKEQFIFPCKTEYVHHFSLCNIGRHGEILIIFFSAPEIWPELLSVRIINQTSGLWKLYLECSQSFVVLHHYVKTKKIILYSWYYFRALQRCCPQTPTETLPNPITKTFTPIGCHKQKTQGRSTTPTLWSHRPAATPPKPIAHRPRRGQRGGQRQQWRPQTHPLLARPNKGQTTWNPPKAKCSYR